jgi:hypothetical protein
LWHWLGKLTLLVHVLLLLLLELYWLRNLVLHVVHVHDVGILLDNETSAIVALELGHVALVASVSKRVVEVLALVASPVSRSESVRGKMILIFVVLLVVFHELLFAIIWSAKCSSLLSDGFFCLKVNAAVFRLCIDVVCILVFLASVTLFFSFEVVVLAVAAFPTTFRKGELFLLFFSFSVINSECWFCWLARFTPIT